MVRFSFWLFIPGLRTAASSITVPRRYWMASSVLAARTGAAPVMCSVLTTASSRPFSISSSRITNAPMPKTICSQYSGDRQITREAKAHVPGMTFLEHHREHHQKAGDQQRRADVREKSGSLMAVTHAIEDRQHDGGRQRENPRASFRVTGAALSDSEITAHASVANRSGETAAWSRGIPGTASVRPSSSARAAWKRIRRFFTALQKQNENQVNRGDARDDVGARQPARRCLSRMVR